MSRNQLIGLYNAEGKDKIAAVENNIGDIWEARVTPFSSTGAGTTIASNSIEIIATTPLFVSSPPTSGIPGKNYKYTAAADGGPYPTFNLVSGPAGMTINPISGNLFWLPTTEGDYDVSISATNSQGMDMQSFTINVVAATVAISNPQLQALGNGNLEASHTNILSTTSSATAWLKNGEPLMDLYMPFEGGADYSKVDYSGNGHEAIPIGNPVWTPDGGHDGNGAYEFDGNSFLLAGNIFPLHSSYTKTVWIYHTVSGEFHHILSGWDHSTDVAGGHGMRVSYDNRLSAGQNGDWRMVQTNSGAIQLNQWYFASLTFDYNSGMMILYVNGAPVDSAVVPSYKLDVTDPGVLIGATQGAFAWKGKIDDARIYNKVLSPEQIAAMYTANGDNIIVAGETADGDIWQSEVTAFSSTEASVPYASNQLSIGAVNQPPTLATIGPQSIDEGSTLTIPVFASDPDAVTPSLSVAPIPANALFVDNNNGTGTFTFTPDYSQQGLLNITFTATDGIESDSETVIITVNNVNRAPLLASIDDQIIAEGSALNLLISATDPDNDTLIFSTDALDENMTFVENFDGSALFSFTPSFLQAGSYDVWFYVNDNSVLTDSQIVQIIVTDVPQNALWAATIQTNGTVVGSAVTQAEVIIGVQLNTDLTAASPPPPEYSTNLQLIASDNSGPYYRDIRELGEDCYYWTLDLDPHGNAGNPIDPQCATMSWNPADFSPDYSYVLREGFDPSGPIVIADMRTVTSYQVCDIQTSRYYTVHWESPICSGNYLVNPFTYCRVESGLITGRTNGLSIVRTDSNC